MFAAVAIVLALTATGLSQDESDKKKAHGDAPPGQPAAPSPEQMQKWVATMSPGVHHKYLEQFVGTWKTQSKMWMAGPGSQPMVSSGVSTIKWVLGGRFIMEEHTGQMMGQPYEGIGLTGYDNYQNMYTFSWYNSMSTATVTGRGTRHPGTGVFTFYGPMDEPMIDVHNRTVKYVTRFIDKDTHVLDIIDLHAGDDYKVIEITYTRDKS